MAKHAGIVRNSLMVGSALGMALALSACGGGGVASTPPPPVVVAPPAPTSDPTSSPTLTSTSTPTPTPPSFNTAEYLQSNSLTQSNAISAYNTGATGRGVTVAIIDSGINPNLTEFSGRIHAASTDVAGTRGLGDDDGHGTSVASIIAGAKNDSGTHGYAFDATLLIARSDGANSCGTIDGCDHDDNNIARGVDLAVANRARVINISLGGSPANSRLRQAIDRATAAGIIIVISAGNDGVYNPALAVNPDAFASVANESVSHGLIIIAGALDSNNTTLSNFSNRAGTGSQHYIAALGRSVRAIDENGTLRFVSGTSFSAPAIVGAVALLAQAFPNLTSAQIIDLLFRTANDLGDPGNDAVFGFGALNLGRAFQPQGQAVLAGSSVAITGNQTSVVAGPMGDAGLPKTGLRAVVLDDYQRAYSVNLDGSITNLQAVARLAPALGINTRTRAGSVGSSILSLSISEQGASHTVEHRLLSPHHVQQARAMAGSFIARLGPKTAVALGISQSGLALVDDVGRRPEAAFLIGRNAARDWGFDTQAGQSIAVRHGVGAWNLFAAAESGTARSWQIDDLTGPAGAAKQLGSVSLGVGRSIGPLQLTGRVTNLIESETVLGASFTGFLSAGGARSWFADTQASLELGRGWGLAGAWRQGWTRVGPGGARLGNDRLQSSAWSVDLSKVGLLGKRDYFGLRVAQPLRVTGGGFDVHLPVSYSYDSLSAGFADQRINLSPSGRETDVEAAWSIPLRRGSLSTNIYWRNQPGNIAAASNDVGAAIRLKWGL